MITETMAVVGLLFSVIMVLWLLGEAVEWLQ